MESDQGLLTLPSEGLITLAKIFGLSDCTNLAVRRLDNGRICIDFWTLIRAQLEVAGLAVERLTVGPGQLFFRFAKEDIILKKRR